MSLPAKAFATPKYISRVEDNIILAGSSSANFRVHASTISGHDLICSSYFLQKEQRCDFVLTIRTGGAEIVNISLEAVDGVQRLNGLQPATIPDSSNLAGQYIEPGLRWPLLKSLIPYSSAWHSFIRAANTEYFDVIPVESVPVRDLELFSRIRQILALCEPSGFAAHIDSWDGEELKGWIKKQDEDDSRLIAVFQDGDEIAAGVQADLPRPDLAAAGLGHGSYAFSVATSKPRNSFVLFTVKDQVTGKTPVFRFFGTRERSLPLYTVELEETGKLLSGKVTSRIPELVPVNMELRIDEIPIRNIPLETSTADGNGARFCIENPLGYFLYGRCKTSFVFPEIQLSSEFNLEAVRKSSCPPKENKPVNVIGLLDAQADQGWLDALFACTPAEARIHLVDLNGANKTLMELHARYDDRIRISTLGGIARDEAIREALESAGSGDIALIRTSVMPTQGWLNSLQNVAALPGAGVAMPFLVDKTWLADWALPGDEKEKLNLAARSFRRASLNLRPLLASATDDCLLLTREFISRAGESSLARALATSGEDWVALARSYKMNVLGDDASLFLHPKVSRAGFDLADADDAPMLGFALARARRDWSQNNRKRILFVTSTRSGGTPKTNQDLMGEIVKCADCYHMRCDSRKLYLTRVSDRGYETLEEIDLGVPIDPFSHVSAEYNAIIARWLLDLDIELLHVRSLIWHGLDLVSVAKRAGSKVVCSFHDYYAINPNLNLVDDAGVFMGDNFAPVPSAYRARAWLQDVPVESADFVDFWRKRMGNKLQGCDAFVTTSQSVRTHLLEALPQIDSARFAVVPHGRDFAAFMTLRQTLMPGEKIRILLLGHINAQKGMGIINSLLEYDQRHRDILEFHLLGSCEIEAHPGLICHGRYERENLAERIASIRPHAGAIFSICNETWCHTLTEAWAHGLPCFVFGLGTLEARMNECGGGWTISSFDTPQCYAEIVETMRSREKQAIARDAIDKWQMEIGAANSCAFMASRYYRLYRRLLIPACSDAKKEYNIALCIREGTGTSFIRMLERCRNDFESEISWIVMRPAEIMAALKLGLIDAVYLQRDTLPRHMAQDFIDLAASNGIPYFMDLDDDLFAITPDNDSWPAVSSYLPALEKLLENASLITASTDELALRLGSFKKPVLLEPNRLSPGLWLNRTEQRDDDGCVRALYFGTYSHGADLAMILDAFDEAVLVNPDLRLMLVGISKDAEHLAKHYVEAIEIPQEARPYPAFSAFLRRLSARADFGIAPLRDTFFNRAKSALKIYEYGAMGLPCLASNVPPYSYEKEMPGLVLCDNSKDAWKDALITAAAQGRENRARGEMAKSHTIARHMRSSADTRAWERRVIEFIDSYQKS